LLTEKRQRMIAKHQEKLNGVNQHKYSQTQFNHDKWRDPDFQEKVIEDTEFLKDPRNVINKNLPKGKRELGVLAFLAASPTQEFMAREIAQSQGLMYANNILDCLMNLYRKGLVDRYKYNTGRILWRYKV
jgi:hypothetical protein